MWPILCNFCAINHCLWQETNMFSTKAFPRPVQSQCLIVEAGNKAAYWPLNLLYNKYFKVPKSNKDNTATQRYCACLSYVYTSTIPILPIKFFLFFFYFYFYEKCSIIQTPAFHLFCPSAPLYMILRCFAGLPAGELWCSLRVPLVVVGEISCGRAVNYSSGDLKGLSPCPFPFTIPLSRPSQFLWATYLSGLKDLGKPILKMWTTKKRTAYLLCTEDGQWKNGTKRKKEWNGESKQFCWKYCNLIMH